jgi:hypothetical protein
MLETSAGPAGSAAYRYDADGWRAKKESDAMRSPRALSLVEGSFRQVAPGPRQSRNP